MLLRFFFALSLFVSVPAWSQDVCEALFRSDDKILETLSDGEQGGRRALLKTLKNSEKALLARLLALRKAKELLYISVYQLLDDDTGYLYLHEMQRALDRGVQVRLLVDAAGSFKLHHSELAYLVESTTPGLAEVKLANPLFYADSSAAKFKQVLKGETSFWNWVFSFNSRVHDKIFLVDPGTPDAVLFLGGRNIADSATGFNLLNQEISMDLEVMIRPNQSANLNPGQASVDMEVRDHFDRLFEYVGHHSIRGKNSPELSRTQNPIQKKYDFAYHLAQIRLDLENKLKKLDQDNFLNTDMSSSDFQLVHDLPNLIRKNNVFFLKWFRWSKLVNEHSIIRSISTKMLKAKKRVDIVTPYFLIGAPDIRKIQKLLLHNTDLEINIYINGFNISNKRINSAAFEELVGPKLMALKNDPRIGRRLKVLAYVGDAKANTDPNFFHMKLVVVDDQFLVSSHNLDFRSLMSNSEFGGWMNSRAELAKIEKNISKLNSGSIEWGSPAWQNLLDQHPEFARTRWLFLALCRLFRFELLL